MQLTYPWNLVKNDKMPNPELDRIIYQCAESLRIVGILLQPFMPSKMELLLNMLGVKPEARSFEHANRPGIDYGKSTLPLGKGTEGTLFPPLRFDG